MAAAKQKSKNQGMELLREDLKNGSFRRVYLLYGEEAYLVQQYKHALMDAVCSPEDSMNRNIHRSDLPEWGALQDEILAMPFFAERRLVVLEDTRLFQAAAGKKSGSADPEDENGDAGTNPEAEEAERSGSENAKDGDMAAALAAFLPKIPETTVLVLVEQPDEKKAGGKKGKVSVDRRGKLYKAVGKYGLAVEFVPQSEQDLRRWMASRLRREKIQITEGAMNRFFEMVGADMSRISTETEKLISYAGEGGTIRREDVEALTSEVLEGSVFRMIDLLARHDCRGALAIFDDLMQLREAPVLILVLILRQFNQMMQAKRILETGGLPGVMSELKKADWQARQLISQARSFTPGQLRGAVEECVRTQQMAQSGHIDMQLAVELLIVKLSGTGRASAEAVRRS